MGSRHPAVVMEPHFERADALAQSSHREELFISVDRDGLYSGLQVFLTNNDWIVRDLVFNVGGFVAQPGLLVWVGVRWKHLKSDPPYLFSASARCARYGAGTPSQTRACRNVKKTEVH